VSDNLRLAHMIKGCETLGPGQRWVLWVSGCSRRCPGCIADPILDAASGERQPVEELAARILEEKSIAGITFSGGEPFEQAAALAALVERLRSQRDFSVMAYSGYTLAELRRSTEPGQQALLAQLDILVDGPFVQGRASNLLWRGSDNQRIHFLTSRHDNLALDTNGPGAGLEFRIRPNGDYFWAGVPGPGFGGLLREQLATMDIESEEIEGVWA
jgi:anaerobic ribonucleoside-triphosphate reductase activating protein